MQSLSSKDLFLPLHLIEEAIDGVSSVSMSFARRWRHSMMIGEVLDCHFAKSCRGEASEPGDAHVINGNLPRS